MADFQMTIVRYLSIAVLASTTLGARAAPLELPAAGPPCLPIMNGFSVVDFSMPVPPLNLNGTPALKFLKADYKVDTIFRYYDYPETETTTGKTLRKEESDAILAAGYKIGTIFQHYNNNPAKFFEPGIGKRDAQQALHMAEENRQPFDTVIYFGVDGPEDNFKPLQEEYDHNGQAAMSQARKDELARSKRRSDREMVKYYDLYLRYGPKALGTSDLGLKGPLKGKLSPSQLFGTIDTYFKEVEAEFKADKAQHGGGYEVGMYCTAVMCKIAADHKLQHIWLSPESRNGDEFAELFKNPKNVGLVQWPATLCHRWSGQPSDENDASFDYNQVNDNSSDLGTWDHKRK